MSKPAPMQRRQQPQPLEHRLLLTATLCLLAGGAVMVYSASSARTLLQGDGDGTAYLVKYLIYGAIGLVAMNVIARQGLESVRRYTPALLLITLRPAAARAGPGLRREDQRRPPLARRRPAAVPARRADEARARPARGVGASPPARSSPTTCAPPPGPIIGVGAAAVLLVAAQPDLGTALVICFTLAAMLVAAGLPLRQLGLIAGVGAFLVLVFAILEPYRRARLTAFMNPWADAGGNGFQSVQGQIALGSGGFFGLGPGQSVQKIFYLPEAHTDFILAVIGEELGVAGICVLLSLYGMIGYAGLRTAKAAKGAYAKLLAAGLTSLILCQALLNVYTVLGLAPLTGVPLPFISSGSTLADRAAVRDGAAAQRRPGRHGDAARGEVA